jgi:hypothetical protein
LGEKIRLRDSPRGHNDFRIFWRESVAPEPVRPLTLTRRYEQIKNNPIPKTFEEGMSASVQPPAVLRLREQIQRLEGVPLRARTCCRSASRPSTPGCRAAGWRSGRCTRSLAAARREEGVRHCGLGAVVAEVARLSMTSSRRLSLAAEARLSSLMYRQT